MDRKPLLTESSERTARRIAMVRSITTTHTGLSVRRHNAVVKLLERLTSDAFSDGTESRVNVKLLAEVMGKSRATIFRWIADAESAGLLVSEQRFNERSGRQLSTIRRIDWKQIAGLVCPRNETLPVSIETPPVSNETLPVSIETPFNTVVDRSNPRSIKEPKKKKTTVHKDSIAGRVEAVCDAIGYRGSDAATIWKICAAERTGVLSEHSVNSALASARALRSGIRQPVHWFHGAVRSAAKMSKPEFQRLLSSVSVLPKLPTSAAAAAKSGDRVPVHFQENQLPKLQDRQRDIQNQLAAIIAAEG